MGSQLVPLCSGPRRTNQAAGSSERGNAKQALVSPCPLQPSMPSGMPASIRPAPLACGCHARRSARHGRLSFDQSVANNILRSHCVTLAGRGVRLRRRLEDGRGVRHSLGDFRRLSVQLVAPPLEGLELSVAAVQHIPDCLFALGYPSRTVRRA